MIGIMGFSAAALVPGSVPALDGLDGEVAGLRAGRSAPRSGDVGVGMRSTTPVCAWGRGVTLVAGVSLQSGGAADDGGVQVRLEAPRPINVARRTRLVLRLRSGRRVVKQSRGSRDDGESCRPQIAMKADGVEVRGAAHVALAEDAVRQERRGRGNSGFLSIALSFWLINQLEDRQEAVVQAPHAPNQRSAWLAIVMAAMSSSSPGRWFRACPRTQRLAVGAARNREASRLDVFLVAEEGSPSRPAHDVSGRPAPQMTSRRTRGRPSGSLLCDITTGRTHRPGARYGVEQGRSTRDAV